MRTILSLIELGMYAMAVNAVLNHSIGKYIVFFAIGLIISVFKKRFARI